jgi:hypothetical protein
MRLHAGEYADEMGQALSIGGREVATGLRHALPPGRKGLFLGRCGFPFLAE